MEVEAPAAPLHTQQHEHPSTSSLFLGGLPRTLIYRIGWEDPPAQVLRWHNGWGAPGSCLALGGKRACCLPSAARGQDTTSRGLVIQGVSLSGHRGQAGPAQATYTWPVSWATTNAEEKPSSWFRVQLRTGWHIPVTGA